MRHRRMNAGLVGLIGLISSMGAAAFADEKVDVTIYLKDGTEVRGELLDYASLRYRVQVGDEVRVLRADEVVFMEFGTLSAPGEMAVQNINVDIDGVDVSDVMDQIGRQVGMPIVVDPGLTGKVSVTLFDLPWREAVDVIAAIVKAEVVDEGDFLLLRPRQDVRTVQIDPARFGRDPVFVELSSGEVTRLGGAGFDPLRTDLYIDRQGLEVVGLLKSLSEEPGAGFDVQIALATDAVFADPASFPANPSWRGAAAGGQRGLPTGLVRAGTTFLARDRFGVVYRVLIGAFSREASLITLSWAPMYRALEPEVTALAGLQGDAAVMASTMLVGEPGPTGGVDWSMVSADKAVRMLAERQALNPARARTTLTQLQPAALAEAFPGTSVPASLSDGAWRVDVSHKGFRQTVFMTPGRQVVALILAADMQTRASGALGVLDNARRLVRKRAWGPALENFERASRLDPQLVEAHHERGTLLAQLDRHEEALEAFTRVIEIDPTNVHAYVLRGVSHEEVGDLERAIADYTRCGELMPSYAPAFYNRGLAKKAMGDELGALADLDQAIALNPNYGMAYAARASVRRSLGDVEGSIADCDQSLRVDPTYVRAWVRRALAKQEQGKIQEAFADLDEALRLDPRSSLALRNRARLRELVGDVAGAIADYERALEVMPSSHSQVDSVRAALEQLRGR